MNQQSNKEILETLKAKVIEAIESGRNLTWNSFLSRFNSFINFATGRHYTGFVNNVLLSIASAENIGDTRFSTFLQLKEVSHGKAIVYRGTRMTPIFLPTFKEVDREQEEEGTKKPKDMVIAGYRRAYVCNIQQTNMIELGYAPAKWEKNHNQDTEPIPAVMDFVSKIPFRQIRSEGTPFYRPSTDEIGMPPFERFHNSFKFCESLLHELVHMTGSPNRLNRFPVGWSNTQDYSKEELVACIGSCLLLSQLKVDIAEEQLTNATAYLQGWLKPLRNDNISMLIEAGAAATAACNYLVEMAKANQLQMAA